MASTAEAKVALEKLLAGNARFAAGTPQAKDHVARRKEVAAGQRPCATVMTCSDSRVCPEYIFDVGLGDVFVVRTAGNVAGRVGLGSIEYGMGHLHTPLLVVLCHTACGAVNAACSELKADHSHPHELSPLTKLVDKVLVAAKASHGDASATVEQNARMQVADILTRSHEVKELVDHGKATIVILKYDLISGAVTNVPL
jgi:carbonic anhydrase